jgi:hypothetical protein
MAHNLPASALLAGVVLVVGAGPGVLAGSR